MHVLEYVFRDSIMSLIQPSVCVKELERQIDQLMLLPAVLLQEVAITRETHSKNSRHMVLYVCVCCVCSVYV